MEKFVILQDHMGSACKVSPARYFGDLSERVQALIGRYEDICYQMEDERDKAIWGDHTKSRFTEFRRVTLDLSDEIASLAVRIVPHDGREA